MTRALELILTVSLATAAFGCSGTQSDPAEPGTDPAETEPTASPEPTPAEPLAPAEPPSAEELLAAIRASTTPLPIVGDITPNDGWCHPDNNMCLISMPEGVSTVGAMVETQLLQEPDLRLSRECSAVEGGWVCNLVQSTPDQPDEEGSASHWLFRVSSQGEVDTTNMCCSGVFP